MGFPVVTGAIVQCVFGAAPSTLSVLPLAMVNMENKPAATIVDNIPFLNIAPFGVCMSLVNPLTAAQTAAALGVLTPGACVPVLPAPWAPGSPTVLIGGEPALNDLSICNCAYGGVITITFAGATTEMIP